MNQQELNMGIDFHNFQAISNEDSDPLSRPFTPSHKRSSSMTSQSKLLKLMSPTDVTFNLESTPPLTDANRQSFASKVGQFQQNHPNLTLTLNPSPDSTSTFFVSESDEESKRANTDSDDEYEEASNYLSQQEIHELNKMHIDHQFLREQNMSLSRELACAKMTAQALRSIIQQKDEQILQMSQDLPPVLLTSSRNSQQTQDPNLIKSPPSNPILAMMKMSGNNRNNSESSSVSSRLRLPFKLRSLSGSSR